MTPRYEEITRRLEAVNERIERLALEQKIGDPKREQEIDALRDETAGLGRALADLDHTDDAESRLADIFEELRKTTALTDKRLAHVETKLDRNGSTFAADPSVLAEGAWLKGMLAGPPTDDADPQLLMDAPRPRVRRGLDELAAAMFNTSSAQEGLKRLKK